MSKASQQAAQELCACQLIKITDEIRLCAKCHRYFKGARQYDSISRVIRTVMPPSYEDVPPITLEVARLRGVFVDSYFSDWLRDPSGVVPLSDVALMIAPEFPRDQWKNAADTANRIERLLEWWQKSGMVATDVQRIVYSDSDGIAGTFDLGTEALILDQKNVAQLQPSYVLQLGAYCTYDGKRDPAILHITKDKIKLVPYNSNKCIGAWKTAVAWYKTLGELR